MTGRADTLNSYITRLSLVLVRDIQELHPGGDSAMT